MGRGGYLTLALTQTGDDKFTLSSDISPASSSLSLHEAKVTASPLKMNTDTVYKMWLQANTTAGKRRQNCSFLQVLPY